MSSGKWWPFWLGLNVLSCRKTIAWQYSFSVSTAKWRKGRFRHYAYIGAVCVWYYPVDARGNNAYLSWTPVAEHGNTQVDATLGMGNAVISVKILIRKTELCECISRYSNGSTVNFQFHRHCSYSFQSLCSKQCAPDISRPPLSKQLMRDTHSSPVSTRYGCISWVEVWPKSYLRSCCAECNIVLYGAAIYRGNIV